MKSPMHKSDIVLYLSYKPHRIASRVIRFVRELKSSCPEIEFCIVTYDRNQEEKKCLLSFDSVVVPQYIYNATSPKRLGYPNKVGKKFIFKPLNVDTPTLLFWLDHQSFRRYWVVEDDVEYTGNFGELILGLSKLQSELLATHVRHLPKHWDYIGKFRAGTDRYQISSSTRLTFLPFHAVTHKALTVIDAAYKRGWAGQYEMTWPAILDEAGLSVMDIGGNGPYVSASNRGRYYIDLSPSDYRKLGSFGTMNIRLKPGREKDILWHPVKTFPDWVRMRWKRSLSLAHWITHRAIIRLRGKSAK